MKLTTVIALFLSTSRAADREPETGVWQPGVTVTSLLPKDHIAMLTAADSLKVEYCLKECVADSVAKVGKNVVCQVKQTIDASSVKTLTECTSYEMTDSELFATDAANTPTLEQDVMWLVNGKEQDSDLKASVEATQEAVKKAADDKIAATGQNGAVAGPLTDEQKAAAEKLAADKLVACVGAPNRNPKTGTFCTLADRIAAEAKLVKGGVNLLRKSYVGYSPHESSSSATKEAILGDLGMSDSQAAWTDSAQIGCIIGFAVFALGYLYAIVMLAIDMRARDAMYKELIDEDIATMNNMGMGSMMKQIEIDLQKRLIGEALTDGADDQLITQALELGQSEFAKYL